MSGRAWRGAGQEFRVETVPGTQVQRYSATFHEGKTEQKVERPNRQADPLNPSDKGIFYTVHIFWNGAQGAPRRFPIGANGPVTVLDAIASTEQPAAKVGQIDVWLERRGLNGEPQKLKIDWVGISQRGETKTNYTLQSGDWLFVQDTDEPNPVDSNLHGEWVGKDDTNGSFSLIFGPDNSIRRITENGDDFKGTYSTDWSKRPHHLDVTWEKLPTNQTIMEFIEDGKLRIECGGDTPRPKAFTDESIVLSRKEMPPAGSIRAETDAFKDLNIANFYRRTGKFAQAHFYYELVRRRYPGTTFARKATEDLAELNRHRITLADGSEGWETPGPQQPQPVPKMVDHAPISDPAAQEISKLREQVKTLERRLAAIEEEKTEGDAKKEPGLARVGQMVVVGNAKTPTAVILKKMELFPGQVLDEKALRTAEKNLVTLKAVITVMQSNHGSGYRDILVTVTED